MRIRAATPPVVAIALIVAAIFLPDPREGVREPRSVEVSRTAYACPGDVNVAAGQIAPARAVKAVGLPGGRSVDGLERVDRWRLAKTSRSTVVEQFGPGSGGAGFFTTTADEAAGGGLIVASCPPTVDESWFVGLGSGAKHESRLQLTNLSDVLAVADISLWGAEGPIEEVGAEGIVLKPRQTQSLNVSKLADGEPELAVRVERRRGAFAVTAFDGSSRVFGGSEAPAPTLAPRRDQILAGLPAGARNRTLVVVNPSAVTSRLSVSVLGRRGPFSPRGLEAVRVPAGRVTALPLPAGIGSDGVSLRVRSEQPVAVVARVAEAKDDYAYFGSTHELDGPALVPGRPRRWNLAAATHPHRTGGEGSGHGDGLRRADEGTRDGATRVAGGIHVHGGLVRPHRLGPIGVCGRRAARQRGRLRHLREGRRHRLDTAGGRAGSSARAGRPPRWLTAVHILRPSAAAAGPGPRPGSRWCCRSWCRG